MKLEDLGYNEAFENFRTENVPLEFEPGRVIAEHRERYIIISPSGEYEAEITGNMRYSAQNREDFPAVGDWVAFAGYDIGFALIHKIFPRFSSIKRQAVGQFGEVQLIGVNIDFAFLVQAADRDFNINRLERYLTICYSSRVSPVIVLTKTDLAEPCRISEIIESIQKRINDVPVFAVSNETRDRYEKLMNVMQKGKTYCMLGSSGVGKSTLLNNLSGKSIMKTDAVSESTNKGRHITSHRELIVLENGSILIDNPGMREVGVADSAGGLEEAFDRIITIAGNCRFKDCTHLHEKGCAVLAAVESGEIDGAAYQNYKKMEKERAYFESTKLERRKRDREFGKFMKNFKKDFKKNK